MQYWQGKKPSQKESLEAILDNQGKEKEYHPLRKAIEVQVHRLEARKQNNKLLISLKISHS